MGTCESPNRPRLCYMRRRPVRRSSPYSTYFAVSPSVQALLATATGAERCSTLRIWNGDTRRLMRMAPLPNKARAVCFSSQGELVAVGLTDGTYMVLHSESLKLLHQVGVGRSVRPSCARCADHACIGPAAYLGPCSRAAMVPQHQRIVRVPVPAPQLRRGDQ
jgi:hypothetical protein